MIKMNYKVLGVLFFDFALEIINVQGFIPDWKPFPEIIGINIFKRIGYYFLITVNERTHRNQNTKQLLCDTPIS